MKYVAPSFLSVDIWHVAQQISSMEAAGCQYLHLDVMDGHFVPNISLGPGWIKKCRPHSKMCFDVHLMVEEPDFILEEFAQAGTEICTVHVEAIRHLDRTLHLIRDLGMRPGLTLNPATPLCTLEEVLPLCDLVLIMSVNPGFGGQSFIPSALDRLRNLTQMRSEKNLDFLIEIDGGINAENAAAIADAGADILVAGNAVFGEADPVAAYQAIFRAANHL